MRRDNVAPCARDACIRLNHLIIIGRFLSFRQPLEAAPELGEISILAHHAQAVVMGSVQIVGGREQLFNTLCIANSPVYVRIYNS